MPGTVNVYSVNGKTGAFPVVAPNWMDVGQAMEYGIVVSNQTDNPITSGELTLYDADALATDACLPDTFEPMQPIMDCGPIVTGQPYDPPVRIIVTPERPIPPHSFCTYAAPCPRQFMQVQGSIPGTTVLGVITRIRRTNYDHYGPMGGIPHPLPQPFSAMMASSPVQASSPAPAPPGPRTTARPGR